MHSDRLLEASLTLVRTRTSLGRGGRPNEIRRFRPHVGRHSIFWTSIWRKRSQQLASMIPRIALVTRKIVFFVS